MIEIILFVCKSTSLGLHSIHFRALKALALMLFVIIIFKGIYDDVEKQVEKLDLKYKDAFLTKYLVYEKDKKLVLNEKGKIVLKNAIVFLVFNLISYPIWRYVIFK